MSLDMAHFGDKHFGILAAGPQALLVRQTGWYLGGQPTSALKSAPKKKPTCPVPTTLCLPPTGRPCITRERLPGVRAACLASKSMFPSIRMLYPHHSKLGVPFSQLQKHKSFMHDWKKWW